ncbi:unnamed protein product, partial [marine sediment metagenome]
MCPQAGVTTTVDIDAKITTHAALATVHQDAPDLILTHKGDASAHHARYTDVEAAAVAAALIGDHADDVEAHHTALSALEFIIDGGGSAIEAGEKGHLEVPFACTIERATLEADQEGSIVVDIWKDTYANFPPTDADSITSATPPTITTAQKYEDSTLTGWTKALAQG